MSNCVSDRCLTENPPPQDNIEHATYAAVFTRDQVLDPMIPMNPRTKGWRVVDMAKHFARQGL